MTVRVMFREPVLLVAAVLLEEPAVIAEPQVLEEPVTIEEPEIPEEWVIEESMIEPAPIAEIPRPWMPASDPVVLVQRQVLETGESATLESATKTQESAGKMFAEPVESAAAIEQEFEREAIEEEFEEEVAEKTVEIVEADARSSWIKSMTSQLGIGPEEEL